MMSALAVLGVLTGLDNLCFGMGLGTLGLDSRRRWQLALAFGLCEAAMPLAGVLIGRALAGALELSIGWFGPLLLAACGVLILLGAANRSGARKFLRGSSWLFTLPLILSIDNLLAGTAITAMRVPLALALPIVGLSSVALSLMGLSCGGAIVRYLPARSNVVAGGTLILVSLTSLVAIP
jgi:putative Mn2+ efflux pump MntP